MPKFVTSQRESSKQFDVQNLPRCYVASLMGLRAKLGAPHPWSTPTLGRPFSYLLSSRRLRNLNLIYLLALATTEQPPSCRCRVIQTPPSSDIKIARLRFLFVLRLRTGIDLRDQADLALARSVTIGSWFSDCIGASSLARRSRIVRVNNHQIGFISTHQKIGHSPSITPSPLFVNRARRRRPLPRVLRSLPSILAIKSTKTSAYLPLLNPPSVSPNQSLSLMKTVKPPATAMDINGQSIRPWLSSPPRPIKPT
jgi:hypothetical protein